MNYIIFGGSGFIGTHLIHLLKSECDSDYGFHYSLEESFADWFNDCDREGLF
ncbi:MAG: hypothetical protein ABS987_04330 [Ruminococcus sp.]